MSFIEVTFKIRPISVPDKVYPIQPPGKRQDGLRLIEGIKIADLDYDVLSELADQFRHDLFEKAGKTDLRG